MQDVRNPALAALRVYADNRLVGAADVCGVDEQVGNFPFLDAVLAHHVHALFDGVLVRAAERGENQVACVGLARRNFHARALFVDRADFRQVGEVELGVYALREHVERDRHDVEVARALAVAEERALNPVRARQNAELGGGYAVPRSLCVWRLISTQSRSEMLRQIHSIWSAYTWVVATAGFRAGLQISLFLRSGLPRLLLDGLADFERKIKLGVAEAFGRVLHSDVRAVLFGFVGEPLYERRAVRAISIISSRDILNVTLRCNADVLL